MLRSLGLLGLVAICVLSGCKGEADHTAKPQKAQSSKQHAGNAGAAAADSGDDTDVGDAAVDSGGAPDESQPAAAGDGGSHSAAGEGSAAGSRAPRPSAAGAGGGAANSEAGRGGSGGEPEPQPSAGQGGAGAGGEGGAAGHAGSGGTPAQPLCTGPTPPASAFSATPAALDAPSAGLGAPEARTNSGSAAPRYRLKDFQPLSCGYNATYGLEAFHGRPTLVALFASWCPYCQAQVGKLQELALELEEAGKPIYVVVVNSSPANSPEGHDPLGEQYQFVDRVTFPLLQDTDQVDAWALHGGFKDDLFVYRSDGVLQAYLASYMGKVPVDLTTPEGYTAVKGVLAGTP